MQEGSLEQGPKDSPDLPLEQWERTPLSSQDKGVNEEGVAVCGKQWSMLVQEADSKRLALCNLKSVFMSKCSQQRVQKASFRKNDSLTRNKSFLSGQHQRKRGLKWSHLFPKSTRKEVFGAEGALN